MPTHGIVRPEGHLALHGVQRGVVGVSDATSGKGVPLTQAEWDAVFSGAGVASKTVAHSWGFQDASGNAVAEVGTDLTAAGTLEYEQTVTGWSRKAIRFTNASTDALSHAGGVGVNPNTTSCLWIGYIDVLASISAARSVIVGGGAAAASELVARHNVTPVTQIKVMAGTAVGTSNPSTNSVRPWVLKYDRTGTAAVVYTDQEKVVGTYNSGVTDGVKGFGASVATSAGMDVLWGACFAGSDAEWSDDNVKAVLQSLGWTIPWS